MTTDKLWDAGFLNERERKAHKDAMAQLVEADWKRAFAEAERIRSNSGRRYRFCNNAAWRRARSCIRETPSCGKPVSHRPVSGSLAEHIYARLQVERREAAKAENKKA